METSRLGTLPSRFALFDPRPAPSPALLRDGLTHPVVWTDAPDSVIWGEHLVAAAREHNIGELPDRCVRSSPADLLLLVLQIEGRLDGYSWEELTRIHQAAEQVGLPDSDHRLQALVSSHGGFGRRIVRYVALPRGLQAAVAAGAVDLSVAERAATLPEAAVARILDAPSLSHSARRQMLDLARELAVKDRHSAHSLLEVVTTALGSDDAVAALRRSRYPALTQMETRFSQIRDATLGGSGVELDPPAYFEGEQFTVRFRFDSAATLARRLRALSALGERCDDLFQLL